MLITSLMSFYISRDTQRIAKEGETEFCERRSERELVVLISGGVISNEIATAAFYATEQ